MLKIHRSCASPHNLCQSTNYPSYYGWLSHVDLANLIVLDATLPLGLFRSRLLHVMTKGHICRHHDIVSLPAVLQQCTACRLAAVAYASSIWFDLTHLTHCQVESLQSKLPVEELMYWFVKTWLVHHLWRRSFYKTCSGAARFNDILVVLGLWMY